MSSEKHSYDVVVVGGGHNGLVAACYLARAGLSVLVLERLAEPGGAATSVREFAGWPVQVSRYADLVSLLPDELITELGLDLRLAPRTLASYTPTFRDGAFGGLLVEHAATGATRRSFHDLTGADDEHAAWEHLHRDAAALVDVIAPTLLRPLPSEREIRAAVDADIWRAFVTAPIAETITDRFRDDTVRGLVALEALGGTSLSLGDPSLVQNRRFLYHLIGHHTGGARVPVGGMGAVAAALTRAAISAGAEILTSAGVSTVDAGPDSAEVTWDDRSGSHTVTARRVLADVAPWVLRILLGGGEDPESKPVGAQLRIDLLLERLPRFTSGIDPAVAFAGALRLGADYTRLEAAYDDAAAGRLPTVLPGEIHCHSLTDPTVLGEAPDGTHVLAYVGLHAPATLFDADPVGAKQRAVSQVLASLDEHLAEPLESCLATDADGRPCIAARSPQDLERELAMPGGHPFHGDLEWPWAPNRARLETPAQQWGVQTDVASVLVCGSGSRRGGGVSGLGGHSAAQAVLAER